MADIYHVTFSYIVADVTLGTSIHSNQGYFVGENRLEVLAKARISGMITTEVPAGSIKVWKVSEPLSIKLSSVEDRAQFSLEPEVVTDAQGKKMLEYRVREKE